MNANKAFDLTLCVAPFGAIVPVRDAQRAGPPEFGPRFLGAAGYVHGRVFELASSGIRPVAYIADVNLGVLMVLTRLTPNDVMFDLRNKGGPAGLYGSLSIGMFGSTTALQYTHRCRVQASAVLDLDRRSPTFGMRVPSVTGVTPVVDPDVVGIDTAFLDLEILRIYPLPWGGWVPPA